MPEVEKRFESFRTSSRFCKKPELYQINASHFIMEVRVQDIFCSSQLSEGDVKEVETVMKNIDKYFITWRNVTFERSHFTRVHQKGDSAEDFVTALHGLSKHCEYGSLQE